MLAYNQLEASDFADYPTVVVDNLLSYKLRDIQAKAEPINEEFWFFEKRSALNSKITYKPGDALEFWSITKMKLLYVTHTEGNPARRAIDTTRFVNGAWGRQIYTFESINGFGTDQPMAHRIFKTKRDVYGFAFKHKLLGLPIRDLTDDITDDPVERVSHDKPVFEHFDGTPSIIDYMSHLINKFSWDSGAIVGVEHGKFIERMLDSNPNTAFTVVDSYKIDTDRYGTNLTNYSIWELKETALKFNELNKTNPKFRFHRCKTADIIEEIPNDSLAFVYFRHTNRTSTARIREEINLWLPKIRPDGWIIGWGITGSNVAKVIDQELPGWRLGHQNLWLREKTLAS